MKPLGECLVACWDHLEVLLYIIAIDKHLGKEGSEEFHIANELNGSMVFIGISVNLPLQILKGSLLEPLLELLEGSHMATAAIVSYLIPRMSYI